ncbi:MAG: TIGR03435 family protein [Limisphaerales bacterium]
MKRGVTMTAMAIAGAVAANSVQAAPVGMAVTVTAAAAKGAAVGGSTLTIIKGALKLMAWSKAQTAIVVGVGVLLAAGTATITLKEIQAHIYQPWQTKLMSSVMLNRMPPQATILSARYSSFGDKYGGMPFGNDSGASDDKMLGLSVSLKDIIADTYGQNLARIVFLDKLPTGKYDYIANLPEKKNEAALQAEIQKKFGLIGRREVRQNNALLLQIQNSSAFDLEASNSNQLSGQTGKGNYNMGGATLSGLAWFLEKRFQIPVFDETGRTNRFDINLKWDENDVFHPNLTNLQRALLDQLGLELVPTNMPVEMLVVEKVK